MRQLIRYPVILLFLLTTPLYAEQSKSFGDYTLHYNAFSSDFLSAEVAKKYGIQRSNSKGLVNITVIKKNNALETPVTANISGNAYNLAGQSKVLAFKEIREGSAVYYLASFRFSNEESLKFNLKVLPKAEGNPINLEFKQTLYINSN